MLYFVLYTDYIPQIEYSQYNFFLTLLTATLLCATLASYQ